MSKLKYNENSKNIGYPPEKTKTKVILQKKTKTYPPKKIKKKRHPVQMPPKRTFKEVYSNIDNFKDKIFTKKKIKINYKTNLTIQLLVIKPKSIIKDQKEEYISINEIKEENRIDKDENLHNMNNEELNHAESSKYKQFINVENKEYKFDS